MNILITGANGYIGRVLVDELEKSGIRCSLDLVDTNIYGQYNYKERRNGIFEFWNIPKTTHNIDVRDYRAMKKLVDKADVIIPLAAIVGMPACDENPEEALDVNTESIRRLVKMCSPDQRIMFPNTNSGYGVAPDGVCTEATPINPISVYGQTKCQAEKIVLEHRNSLVFRLATVFGVSPRMRMDLLVNDLTWQIYRKDKLSVFQPYAKRNYVHVKDVANAFIWGIDNGGEQQIYNFGNDEANMRKIDLVNLINEYMPTYSKSTITVDNETKDPDKRDYFVSSEKLAKAGFKAELSLRVGITELLRLYRTFDDKTDLSYMRNH